MKVLHLLGAAEDNGGILSTLRGLSEASHASGGRHHVWVNAAYRESRRPALDYRRTRHGLDESGNHLLLAWRAWRSFRELRQLLADEPFDVIHAHTRGAFLVARMVRRILRRPVAFTNHAYARRVGMYRQAARLPGMFTVLLTPTMARHYGLEPAPPTVRCISECCRDSFFAMPLAAEVVANHDDVIDLVGLGNVVRWKKWDLVVRALRTLPPDLRRRVRFTLWGPTPEDADAQAFHRELALAAAEPDMREIVKLAGPTANASAALGSAQWFVLPSTNEPCSVALIEALALGVPALASASGGNRDLLQDGRTGILFKPDDVASFTECLARIIQRQFRPGPRDFIRESVRMRSASAVAQEHARLYEDVRRTAAG